MDHLVFDTSAILNFGQRDHLEEVLPKLGKLYRIITTHEVVLELSDPAQREFNARLLAAHFPRHHPAAPPFDVATISRLAVTLGAGEISVIALATELKAVAVLDDRAARVEAEKLDLRITGTLGLIHEALKQGWLTDDQCLEKVRTLHANRFRIRKPNANESFADYFGSMP